MQEESKKELNEDQIRDLCLKIFSAINREIDAGKLEENRHKIPSYLLEDNEDVDTEEIVYYLLFETLNINTDALIFDIVEQEGGEGMGDYANTVIFFHDKLSQEKGTYYKFEYGYYSYHGFDMDDLTVEEVVPVTKTIVVFE